MEGINVHLKKRLFSEILVCLLFFIYLYPLKFVFFPWASTRVILGGIGIGLIILNIICGSIHLRQIKKKWISISLALFFLFIISYITSVINGVIDKSFIYNAFSMACILFAAYTVYVVTIKMYGEFTFKIAARYMVQAVVIQMLLTFIMFISPEFREFLLNLLVNEYEIEYDKFIRFFGFGSHSFTAGVVNSFALLVVAINIKYSYTQKKLFWFLTALLIIVIGSIMARTTWLGGVFLCVILIYGTSAYSVIKGILKYSFIALFFICLVIYFVPKDVIENSVEPYFKFGFEMFYNFMDNGKFSTASTDGLAEMQDTYPHTVKTWLIGDGRYMNPADDQLYYMNTDVGYARLLFYFGLIGSITFFFYQFLLIKIAYKIADNKMGIFFIAIAFLLLLLNLKGFTDFTPFVGILLFCTAGSSKNKIFSVKSCLTKR